MLPHITAQQRRLAKADRVHTVFGFGHFQATVGVLDQPGPAGAELTRACGGKLFLEGVNGAKAVDQRLFQLTRHLAFARTHHFPKLVVVPQLRDVVEDTALGDGICVIGAFDDLFHGLAVPLGARDQLVAVVDISLVVQVVVIFQRFGRHAFGCQRVMGIGKIGKFKSHLGPL